MPNQMIALQARVPNVDPLGGAIRNNAAMINMAQQQQVLQRQNAIAEQTMQIQRAQEQRAGAEEGRKVSQADVELASARLALYRDQAAQVRSPEGYANWLTGVRKESPEIARAFETNLPFEQFTPEKLQFMTGTAEQVFNARYPKAVASTQISAEGDPMTSVASGIPGGSFIAPQPDISKPLNRAASTASPTTPSNVPARATRGGATTPQDLLRQGVDPNSIPSGNPLQPMSAVNNGADFQGIVQNMMQTGVVSQSDFAVLQQTAGPEKAGELAQVLRANNIKIMPSEPMGGMRSAVYRPDQDGMPFQRAIQSGETPTMQQVQYDPSAYGRVKLKSPMQSPMPGSAIVPLPRVRAQAEAESAGHTAGSTKSPAQLEAEGYASKKGELRATQEKSKAEDAAAASGALLSVRQQIKYISELYDSPGLPYITGGLRGSLPAGVNFLTGGGQAAFDAQALASNVGDTSALEKLLEVRRNSPTGAGVSGVSDKDIILLKNSAAVLQQTQGTPAYQKHLLDYNKQLRSIEARLSGVAGENIGRDSPQDARINYIQGLLDSGASKDEINVAAKRVGFDLNQAQLDANLSYRAKGRRARIAPKPSTAASGGGLRTGDPEMDAIMRKHGRK
jgi:hypothetical protein